MSAAQQLRARLKLANTRPCPECGRTGDLYYLRILSSYTVVCDSCLAYLTTFEAYQDARGELEIRNLQGSPI